MEVASAAPAPSRTANPITATVSLLITTLPYLNLVEVTVDTALKCVNSAVTEQGACQLGIGRSSAPPGACGRLNSGSLFDFPTAVPRRSGGFRSRAPLSGQCKPSRLGRVRCDAHGMLSAQALRQRRLSRTKKIFSGSEYRFGLSASLAIAAVARTARGGDVSPENDDSPKLE